MAHGLYICLFLASLGGLAIVAGRVLHYCGLADRDEERASRREREECEELERLMQRADYR